MRVFVSHYFPLFLFPSYYAKHTKNILQLFVLMPHVHICAWYRALLMYFKVVEYHVNTDFLKNLRTIYKTLQRCNFIWKHYIWTRNAMTKMTHVMLKIYNSNFEYSWWWLQSHMKQSKYQKRQPWFLVLCMLMPKWTIACTYNVSLLPST